MLGFQLRPCYHLISLTVPFSLMWVWSVLYSEESQEPQEEVLECKAGECLGCHLSISGISPSHPVSLTSPVRVYLSGGSEGSKSRGVWLCVGWCRGGYFLSSFLSEDAMMRC